MSVWTPHFGFWTRTSDLNLDKVSFWAPSAPGGKHFRKSDLEFWKHKRSASKFCTNPRSQKIQISAMCLKTAVWNYRNLRVFWCSDICIVLPKIEFVFSVYIIHIIISLESNIWWISDQYFNNIWWMLYLIFAE